MSRRQAVSANGMTIDETIDPFGDVLGESSIRDYLSTQYGLPQASD